MMPFCFTKPGYNPRPGAGAGAGVVWRDVVWGVYLSVPRG